jgi:apolipoprotein N-acyltransferase
MDINDEAAHVTSIRTPVVQDRRWWIWFLLALGFGAVASGKWTVAAAAWLFPIFLVRVMRAHRPAWAYLLGVGALAFAGIVGWRGVIPGVGEGWLFVGIVGAMAVVETLPFLMDRLLYPRLRGLVATLALPTAFVAFHFMLAFVGPSTGLVAYSLYGNDALIQFASVAGVWGLSFLVLWVASGVNQLWEDGFRLPSRGAPGLVPLAVVLGVVLWGGLRLAMVPSQQETVRVALVAYPTTLPEDVPWLDREVEQRFWFGAPLNDDQWEQLGQGARWIQENLLEATAREAASGARMVFWAEANGLVRTDDQEELIARGAELAREHGIYLGMSLMVLPRSLGEGFLNKLVLVDPDGTEAARYRKARPVPGPESWYMEAGDGEMAVVDTPWGRLGIVICYDLDYVRDMRQVAGSGVDILIQPSLTWPAIAQLHTEMATFRAVEYGVSLVRPTLNGVSVATDPQGRILSRMEDGGTEGYSTTAEIPVQGAATFYSRFGDWAGWLALIGLPVLVLVAVRRRKPPVAEEAVVTLS